MSDPLPAPEASRDAGEAERRKLTVTIYDEDAVETFHVEASSDATVGHVIAEFYRRDVHRERREDDRLRCKADGGDVFAHHEERLEEYAERSCRELTWVFVGGTGGA